MPKITCPSCTTSYELPDGSIDPKGRKVKCASCGSKWLAKPETIKVNDPVLDSIATGREEASAPDAWTAINDTPIDADFEDIDSGDVSLYMPPEIQEMPRQRARPINPLMRSNVNRNKQTKVNRYAISEQKRKKRNVMLRPLSLVASLGLIAGIIHMREPIVRIVPDLAGLFAMVGFDVNLRGFEIRNIRSERVVENTGPILIITGEIENVRNVISPAPKLRFGLKTNTNEEIYAWDHELSVPTIVPGGITRFQSRLPSPPQLGRNISVQFTDG